MVNLNLNRNGTGATGRGINMHSPMATAKIPFTQINNTVKQRVRSSLDCFQRGTQA